MQEELLSRIESVCEATTDAAVLIDESQYASDSGKVIMEIIRLRDDYESLLRTGAYCEKNYSDIDHSNKFTVLQLLHSSFNDLHGYITGQKLDDKQHLLLIDYLMQESLLQGKIS